MCRAAVTLSSHKSEVRVDRNAMTARLLEDGSRVQTGDDCVKTTVGSQTIDRIVLRYVAERDFHNMTWVQINALAASFGL